VNRSSFARPVARGDVFDDASVLAVELEQAPLGDAAVLLPLEERNLGDSQVHDRRLERGDADQRSRVVVGSQQEANA